MYRINTQQIDRTYASPPGAGYPPYPPLPQGSAPDYDAHTGHTHETGGTGHHGRDELRQPQSHQYHHQTNHFPPEDQHNDHRFNNPESNSEVRRPLDRRQSPPSPPPPPIPVYVNNYGKNDHSSPEIQSLQYHPDPPPFHDRSESHAGSIILTTFALYSV